MTGLDTFANRRLILVPILGIVTGYRSMSPKPQVARICLTISAVLFLLGFLILCFCPGWYGIAAAFAGVAAWSGTGRVRTWAIILCAASLIMTGLDTYGKIKEHERRMERVKRAEQQLHSTNAVPSPVTVTN
jgi:hypothetical protein